MTSQKRSMKWPRLNQPRLNWPRPSTLAAILFLSLSASAASADPPPLSELEFLPGDLISAPASGRQHSPELSAGDGQYLAVWVEERGSNVDIVTYTGGPTYHPYAGSKWDIYAARVDLDGNLIDQTPIVVSMELKNQAEPDVAWNGENWLVTWSGQAGIECCADENIYAARVSPSGVVLDVPSIVVDLDESNSGLRSPTVGSDGTNWVVAWRDLDGGIFTIDGTRIAPDGTLLDPGGVFLRHDTRNSYPVKPDIVWAGDEFLLIWEEGSGGVRGQRLTADLTKIGGAIFVNANYWVGFNAKVATNGTDFFVTWGSEPPGQNHELAGARITHDGVVLDRPPLLLTALTPGFMYDPAVAWDGTNWMVAFNRGGNPLIDLFAIRVSTDGTILDYDTAAIPVSTAAEQQWEATIAGVPGGGGVFVAWRDYRYTPISSGAHGDVFGVTLTPDGTVGTAGCVAMGAPRQTLLHMVANDSGYMAVYRSETSPETRILAQRLFASGSARDAEPIVVAASEWGFTNPSVAWNGSVYFFVWEDVRVNRIFGRRYDQDMNALDLTPIDIMPGNVPNVAAIGDLFLTVSTWENPHEVRGAYSVRVRGSDGTILDFSPRLFSSGYAVFPSVTAFGDQWLVAWESHPTHDDPSNTAKGNFVSLAGAPGSVFIVDSDATRPVVAAGPDHAVIVFAGDSGPGYNDDIFARRILSDGTFLDPVRGIQVTLVLNRQHEPSVTWDGSNYVTAFGDLRDADSDGSFMGEIYGARITGDGDVLDPNGYAVANDVDRPEMFPAVAGQAGEFVTGGAVFNAETGAVNYRIGLRSLGSVADVSVEPADPFDPSAQRALVASQNPFARDVSIHFRTESAAGHVSVGIYDTSGRAVRSLYDGPVSAEQMTFEWNGRDDTGADTPSGVYFVRARLGSTQAVMRLIRL